MRKFLMVGLIVCTLFSVKAYSQVTLVNKNASPEAKALYSYIQNIAGKQILTAQHEQLYEMSQSSDSIYKITGKYPAIWGGDWGFSDERHDIDNIKYRPKLLEEILKQYAKGSIITMTYHQSTPVTGEPTDFNPGVMGKLTPEQYKELLTPVTKMYESWKVMVDNLAGLFKTLQGKNIPVLFRPYHETNGGWFWWSGAKGDSCSIKLYRQLYNYYTNTLKLNNLIWVWSPSDQNYFFAEYYPGAEYVDILGLDIYPPWKNKECTINDIFRQETYDTILKFAQGKPITIGECSTMPTVEIFEKQPKWCWMMGWVGSTLKGNSKEALIKLYNSKRVATRDDVKY